MISHTPGPWHVMHWKLEEKIGHIDIAHQRENGTDNIASLRPYIGNEANARLIAAAPCLLKALEATLEALHRFTTGQIHHPTTVPEVEQMALAAIAKAKGKS